MKGRYVEMKKKRCDDYNEEMRCERCWKGKRFAKRKRGLYRICREDIRFREKKRWQTRCKNLVDAGAN